MGLEMMCEMVGAGVGFFTLRMGADEGTGVRMSGLVTVEMADASEGFVADGTGNGYTSLLSRRCGHVKAMSFQSCEGGGGQGITVLHNCAALLEKVNSYIALYTHVRSKIFN